MRRLAMVALAGSIAFAQLGIEQWSSGAAGTAPARERRTTIDHARATMALPRTVAVAPVDEDRLAASRRAAGDAERRAAAAERRADTARRAADVADRASRSRRPAGDVWAALAACESGGNPSARSASGRYFGAFQFSLATWRSLGYGGNPADHSFEVQLQAAQRLQARSGWGQWPRCSRRLGLR